MIILMFFVWFAILGVFAFGMARWQNKYIKLDEAYRELAERYRLERCVKRCDKKYYVPEKTEIKFRRKR